MNKFIKYASSIIGLTLASITLTSCTDYGYEFHFAVIGGNDNITAIDVRPEEIYLCSEFDSNELDCPEGSHVFSLLGGKNSYYEITFMAEPDEGYEVKQWFFNNEIVPGNNTTSFLAKVSSSISYRGFIAVEFEIAHD